MRVMLIFTTAGDAFSMTSAKELDSLSTRCCAGIGPRHDGDWGC